MSCMPDTQASTKTRRPYLTPHDLIHSCIINNGRFPCTWACVDFDTFYFFPCYSEYLWLIHLPRHIPSCQALIKILLFGLVDPTLFSDGAYWDRRITICMWEGVLLCTVVCCQLPRQSVQSVLRKKIRHSERDVAQWRKRETCTLSGTSFRLMLKAVHWTCVKCYQREQR